MLCIVHRVCLDIYIYCVYWNWCGTALTTVEHEDKIHLKNIIIFLELNFNWNNEWWSHQVVDIFVDFDECTIANEKLEISSVWMEFSQQNKSWATSYELQRYSHHYQLISILVFRYFHINKQQNLILWRKKICEIH